MGCDNILRLNGCEVAGSTFEGRHFKFPNRDISQDNFWAKVKGVRSVVIAEIQGVKNGSDVYFPFTQIEALKVGRYTIDYWATFTGLSTEKIATEEFTVR